MSTRGLAVLTLCSALALATSVRAGDREEDEEPVARASSVPDALIMLGRGREDRAWEILGKEGNATEARKAALAALEGDETNGRRGAALYLGSRKVWGKEDDHPEWRAPLEKRLEKVREKLQEIQAKLEDPKLDASARQGLVREQTKVRVGEVDLLEAIGLLGTKEIWKEQIGLVRKSDSEAVIRGAARGLSGPRGDGVERLVDLLNDFERGGPAGKEPPLESRVAIIRVELEQVARSESALDLVTSLERRPSAAGVKALQRLVSTKALERAWRVVERAGREQSPTLRVAAAELAPKLRGRNSKIEFLANLVETDPEVGVRVAAASAMGRLGRREAASYLSVLVEALKDEVPVRQAAGKALIQLTGHRLGPVHKAWEAWLAKQE